MAMLATWRDARKNCKTPDSIPFTKEQIVFHGNQLHELKIVSKPLPVKNVPDIIYTFRAREDLPDEILKEGHVAIVGGGRGRYTFEKIPRPNRFRLPEHMTEVVVGNQIPQWAWPYLGNDEQGT